MRFSPINCWFKHLVIILTFCATITNTNAQVDIDSLLSLTHNNRADTLIVKELSQKANEIKFEHPNDAIKLSLEAIKISKSLNFTKGLIYNYQLLGDAHYQIQKYEKAIQDYEIGLEYSKSVNDSVATMACYLNIGAILFTQGVNNRALDNFLLALKYAEQEKKGAIYNNIGLVFFKEEKYDDALAYYIKSIDIKKKIGDQLGVAVTYTNIGEVYKKMKKYDIAKVYFKKSYAISNEIDDREGAAFYLNNFGEISKSRNQLDSSIIYFKKALVVSEEINNQFLIAQSLYNIGHSYFVKEEFSMAEPYLERCYNLSKSLEILPEIEKSARILSEIYKRNNNFQQAYKYLNINKVASDSLNLATSEKQLLKLKLDYKYKLEEEKSKRLLELKKNEYKKAEFKLILIIFFVILLLLVIVFLFVRAKFRMRINRIEKEKIELKKENLEKELEFKNKEIIEKVLKIIEKNELIESTVRRLNEFSLSLPSTKRAEVNLINKELKSMEKVNQWTEFHHYFTLIYSKFFENLEKDYPDLTINEKRLSAYLKLNMSTKDIATLTFQNFKSIEVARTRLRKRFDLTNTDIGFQEFFSKYN